MNPQNSNIQQPTLSHSQDRHSKINLGLRRKTKSKDHRAIKMSSYIQDINPQNLLTPAPAQAKHLPASVNHKLTLSEHRKPQKQNMHSDNFQEDNIFREPSTYFMAKGKRSDLRLPTLSRKKTNLFQQDSLPLDPPEKRPKIVRIPLQKLIALNTDEVKRRFMLKYHLTPLEDVKQ